MKQKSKNISKTNSFKWAYAAFGFSLILCLSSCTTHKNNKPCESTSKNNKDIKQVSPASYRTQQLAEWESLKYGICFHFGMSTFTGKEIDDGKSPSTTYAPTNLDVKQWIRVVKEAGAKYALLTSKHVAGHCLWDSENYDYDVATSSNKTDVVAEFMAACKAEGIKPYIYYCVLDAHNENGIKWTDPVNDQYFNLIKHHLTELHTRYPGIYVQLLDIPAKLNLSQRQELYTMIKTLSPDCIVIMNQGFRDGTGFPQDQWPTDILNGERTLPPAGGHNPVKEYNGKKYYLPMEVWETIGERWFWEPDDMPKTTRTLYTLYKNSTDRGANFFLSIAPDKTGRIPDYDIKALMELKKVIDNPSLLPPPKSLTYDCPIKASGVYDNRPEYQIGYAVDEDPATRWAAPRSQKQAWLEVDLKKEVTFDKAFLSESWARVGEFYSAPKSGPKNWNNIKKFQLQTKSGDSWQTFAEGTVIGEGIELTFAPIKARYVRLNILDSNGGPTISEFQLFAAENK